MRAFATNYYHMYIRVCSICLCAHVWIEKHQTGQHLTHWERGENNQAQSEDARTENYATKARRSLTS